MKYMDSLESVLGYQSGWWRLEAFGGSGSRYKGTYSFHLPSYHCLVLRRYLYIRPLPFRTRRTVFAHRDIVAPKRGHGATTAKNGRRRKDVGIGRYVALYPLLKVYDKEREHKRLPHSI
jgi:hypothetical protein